MAAAAKASEAKLSLKILIDHNSNKVIFAEAGKEFVDFIFHIMSLPLSTVVKLLNEEGMVGCLGDLYKSIDSLNTQYFESNRNKDSVLQVRSPLSIPWLSPEVSNNNQYSGGSRQGFVKDAVAYMVMDNLEVKPMSISLIKSHAKDFDSLEERHVQVGLHEGLAMLKASLETKNVLTAVFLGKRYGMLNCPSISGIGWVGLFTLFIGALHLIVEIPASKNWLIRYGFLNFPSSSSTS